MAADNQATTLEQLKPGQSGIILSVGNSDRAVRRRLIDMGLTPGTSVYMRKAAPFGDPFEVMVRGYELSLRKADAAQISIGGTPRGGGRRGGKRIRYRKRPLDDETLRRMRLHHERESRYLDDEYKAHDSRKMKIALVGNPNSGKTTLFNSLTGSDQQVGNWPGVTVEKKEGQAKVDGSPVTIVDLPGIYSLSPYSLEEVVARDFIIEEKPDAIINIVDATNLERNLYLTIQLLELEKPMVVALNFMDELEKSGDCVDVRCLSERLGVPVIPISARSGVNLSDLLSTAHRQMHVGYTVEPDDLYDEFTHEIHHRVFELISEKAHRLGLPTHWASIKLLEGDDIIEKALGLDNRAMAAFESIAREYEASSRLGDRETLIADSRYGYIAELVKVCFTPCATKGNLSPSDRIDQIVTHKYLALPVFLAGMLVIFSITFGPFGAWLSDSAGVLIDDHIGGFLKSALEAARVAPWLTSLVTDGIVKGVGGVLTFLPQIALLFFFLSLLEDTGYMARAAFIMDRLLARFGLSGKAFIPMLMGFGCTVPAVMGARAMDSEKDRRMTVMLVPFMSCSAKLPVYGLISSAFFGKNAGLVVFFLYVLGLVLAIVSGLIFKSTIFKGETAAFVLELPPYRMPTAKNTLLHVWEKIRGFLVRAGTLILVTSVALWFLQSFDLGLSMVESTQDSILSRLGSAIAPVFRPLGFGTWEASVALLTGLMAKEAVVASLSLFYGFSLNASDQMIAGALGSTFASPLAALAFLVFILLYVPCVAAVSAIHKEMNSLKWTLVSVGWQLAAAYIASFLVYRLGGLLGF